MLMYWFKELLDPGALADPDFLKKGFPFDHVPMMLNQQPQDGIGRTGEELRIFIRRIDKRNRTSSSL